MGPARAGADRGPAAGRGGGRQPPAPAAVGRHPPLLRAALRDSRLDADHAGVPRGDALVAAPDAPAPRTAARFPAALRPGEVCRHRADGGGGPGGGGNGAPPRAADGAAGVTESWDVAADLESADVPSADSKSAATVAGSPSPVLAVFPRPLLR